MKDSCMMHACHLHAHTLYHQNMPLRALCHQESGADVVHCQKKAARNRTISKSNSEKKAADAT